MSESAESPAGCGAGGTTTTTTSNNSSASSPQQQQQQSTQTPPQQQQQTTQTTTQPTDISSSQLASSPAPITGTGTKVAVLFWWIRSLGWCNPMWDGSGDEKVGTVSLRFKAPGFLVCLFILSVKQVPPGNWNV